jgi:hypothetical protein
MKRFYMFVLLALFMFSGKVQPDFTDILDNITNRGISFSTGDSRYRHALQKALYNLKHFDIYLLTETAIHEAAKEDIKDFGEKANNKIYTTNKDIQSQVSLVQFAVELWNIDSAAYGGLVVKIFHEIIQAQKQYIPKKFSWTLITNNSFVRMLDKISTHILLRVPQDLLRRNAPSLRTTTKDIQQTTTDLHESVKDFLDFALRVGQRAFWSSNKNSNIQKIKDIETNLRNYGYRMGDLKSLQSVITGV